MVVLIDRIFKKKMEEQKTDKTSEQESKEAKELDQVSSDMELIVKPVNVELPKEEKKSEFPGQEIEQPSIRETSSKESTKDDKSIPVIIEWKKPFIIMFALGVVAMALMYFFIK